LGYTFLQILFIDTHRCTRLVRFLKAFSDIKGLIRIRSSKNRQHNGKQKSAKGQTTIYKTHTYQTKDRGYIFDNIKWSFVRKKCSLFKLFETCLRRWKILVNNQSTDIFMFSLNNIGFFQLIRHVSPRFDYSDLT
jgi:hypothetical protein